MILLYIVVGTIVIFALALAIAKKDFLSTKTEEKAKYKYTRKNSFLTPAEFDFYNSLGAAVGHEYRIFAQVHLSSLVDHTVAGQNWRAALAHINQKSVDFVLCDKEHLSPKLAIELDDRSHQQAERQDRDQEVERILREANLPLLRFQNKSNFDPIELTGQIKAALVKTM